MRKKTILLALLCSSYPAIAYNDFTGNSLGITLEHTTHDLSIPSDYVYGGTDFNVNSASKGISVGLLYSYGFDFAGDFIGQIEGKIRTGGSTTKNKVGEQVSKEKFHSSISYLQGYRIDQILPYIKAGLAVSTYQMNKNAIPTRSYVEVQDGGAIGFGYGAGVKYGVDDNFILGIEYYQTDLRSGESKFKTKSLSLTGLYSF